MNTLDAYAVDFENLEAIVRTAAIPAPRKKCAVCKATLRSTNEDERCSVHKKPGTPPSGYKTCATPGCGKAVGSGCSGNYCKVCVAARAAKLADWRKGERSQTKAAIEQRARRAQQKAMAVQWKARLAQ